MEGIVKNFEILQLNVNKKKIRNCEERCRVCMEISFAFSPSPPPFDLGDTLPVKGPENFGPGKKEGQATGL